MDLIDVVMVYPPGGDVSKPNFRYHLGSAYIIAYLRKNGVDALQFISGESLNVFECVNQIMGYEPKIVGFSVYLANFLQSALIARELKRVDSKVIIVFGGPTPTFQSKIILENSNFVDVCVRGEGEEIFLQLINTLSANNYNLSKEVLQDVKGITFRTKEEVIVNPDSNILLMNRTVKNYLDKYPSPLLTGVIPAAEAPTVGIITARGCNQNCIYCNCAMLSKQHIFTHSIDRVLDELIYLDACRDRRRITWIWDDAFTLLPNRTKKICQKVIDNGLRLKLSCITRADIIDEELLDLLKDAGIVEIGFGLESAVPHILRKIGKVHPAEDEPSDNLQKEITYIENVKKMAIYSKEIGLRTFVYVMQGLPGESLVEARETMNFVRDLNLDYHVTQHLIIYPGTPIFSKYEKYGYQIKRGTKNKAYLKTIHPFDLNSIKIASKSLFEKDGVDYDTKNYNVLALNTKRDSIKNFFDNVILCSNSLNPTLIEWLQHNLAINGTFIHIYTDKGKLLENYDENIFTLNEYFSPTLQYHSYLREKSNNTAFTLIPRRVLIRSDEKFGKPMQIINTEVTLMNDGEPPNNVIRTIAVDFEKRDAQKLHALLLDASITDDIFDLPVFTKSSTLKFLHLCRWTRNTANCQTFDTAIIGNDNTIRLCWHGTPIGKVGLPFSKLLQNFSRSLRKTMEERACSSCVKNDRCVKCVYAYPLSTEEYCGYKRNHELNDLAELLRAFRI